MRKADKGLRGNPTPPGTKKDNSGPAHVSVGVHPYYSLDGILFSYPSPDNDGAQSSFSNAMALCARKICRARKEMYSRFAMKET